jgi:hypothetical protein
MKLPSIHINFNFMKLPSIRINFNFMKLPSIHINFNFMKLASIHINLCLKQVYEITTPSHNSHSRSAMNSASCKLQLLLTVPVPACSRSCRVTCDALFMGGSRRRKARNSLTTENMTHTDIDSC